MERNNLNWSLEYYETHTDECNEILNSLEDFDEIPFLDSSSLQTLTEGTLIRYRGMIQDMLNPEYYPSSFTVLNKESNETSVRSGKYRDIASCKANEEVNLKEGDFIPSERLVYFCIPIPGINDWVYDLQKPQKTAFKQNETSSPSGVKRSADEEETEMETEPTHSNTSTNTKKNKSSEETTGSNTQTNIYSNKSYFPISTENGITCMIKIYEEEEKSGLVLNDTIEVIGFLSLNPSLEANWECSDAEDKVHHPPPSLVPRVHAVVIKKLKHCNPLLKQIIPYGDVEELIKNARSDLSLVLTQLLFEDTLAAEYLICHLISRIYVRNETNTIGKFSLNLFNIHFDNFGSSFYDIIKTLVTNSHYVPLTINLLNEKSFVPKMNYETNKLQSGMLQLCDDLHLILDETKMNEGQLNNTGCLNISALQKMFLNQEIQYDFGYYQVKYNTNFPLLVISEGKSMFEADVRVKINSESYTESNFNESLQALQLYLNTEVLNKIRIYLTAVRLRDFELGEQMMQKIGEDYVSLRQKDREVTSSDLHMLLILSRLLALSHGRSALCSEDWAQALDMEAERKNRLSVLQKLISTVKYGWGINVCKRTAGLFACGLHHSI